MDVQAHRRHPLIVPRLGQAIERARREFPRCETSRVRLLVGARHGR